jgi:hypothetical protein
LWRWPAQQAIIKFCNKAERDKKCQTKEYEKASKELQTEREKERKTNFKTKE